MSVPMRKHPDPNRGAARHRPSTRALPAAALVLVAVLSGCGDRTGPAAPPAAPSVSPSVPEPSAPPPPASPSPAPARPVASDGAFHVHPGEEIQPALEAAAATAGPKRVVVHAGTYAPRRPGQAMVWFNQRHDGITLEARGEVILTAVNPAVADPAARGHPAIVNHVVYFGDGVTGRTVLRGVTITGANGFVTQEDQPPGMQPRIEAPGLDKGKFFYTDGGGIKVFGRSYPVIEGVTVADHFVSPCGAGISIEHRGHSDGSRLQSVQIRHCIFRRNRCPVSGAAVDLLHGSSAEIVNCLFVGNLSNEPMDEMARTPGQWKPTHGSGALTLFPGSRVLVRRCTFTGNRNAVDDSATGNLYEDCLFWNNTAPGGWPPGGRYELDIESAIGVTGCRIGGGGIHDLRKTIDPDRNVLGCADPLFDDRFVPQAPGFESVGYRPVPPSDEIPPAAAPR